MDAPLSREGIMESLSLCSFLKQYDQSNELSDYGNIFENTRNEINDIIPLLSESNDENSKQEILSKLQQCLNKMDQYERQKLILKHPPPDDDNLRLPQPVPEIPRHTPIYGGNASNSFIVDNEKEKEKENEKEFKLDNIDEDNKLNGNNGTNEHSNHPMHPQDTLSSPSEATTISPNTSINNLYSTKHDTPPTLITNTNDKNRKHSMNDDSDGDGDNKSSPKSKEGDINGMIKKGSTKRYTP
eukprot:40806_1